MKFRKKPITVDACRWFKNGDHPDDYANPRYDIFRGNTRADRCKAEGWEGEVVRRFRRPDVDGDSMCRECGLCMRDHGWIDTSEGGHIVCRGDWIITGVKGEHYPCKPDIFEATYEAEDLLAAREAAHDAAIREQAEREQMEVDCKVQCAKCERGDELFEDDGEWIHGVRGCVFTTMLCDATETRAAWAKEHPEEKR